MWVSGIKYMFLGEQNREQWDSGANLPCKPEVSNSVNFSELKILDIGIYIFSSSLPHYDKYKSNCKFSGVISY